MPSRALRHFIIVGTLVALLTGAVVLPFHHLQVANEREAMRVRDGVTLRIAYDMLRREVHTAVTDLKILGDNSSMHLEVEDDPQNHLLEHFLIYLNAHKYRRIFYVDQEGRERLRATQESDGRISVRSGFSIRNHSEFDYFRKVRGMAADLAYISFSDPGATRMSGDGDEVLVRVAIPVFDHLKHRRGVVVADAHSSVLLDHLMESGRTVSDQFAVLDSSGRVVLGIGSTFAEGIGDAWQVIAANRQGEFEDSGDYAFMTFDMSALESDLGVVADGTVWKLIAYVRPAVLEKVRSDAARRYASLYAMLLAPGLLLGWVLAVTWGRRLAAENALRAQSALLEQKVASRTAALREAKERLQRVYDNASDAIFVHDAAGCLIEVNRRACEILGYERRKLLTLNVSDVEVGVHPSDAIELWVHMAMGEHRQYEGRLRRCDGELIEVDVRVAAIGEGDERFFVALAGDITQRKTSESALLRAHRALKTLSGVNRALGCAADEGDLLQEVCDIIVGHGGYRFVWVGFAGPGATCEVHPVSWAGFEAGYVQQLHVTWDAGAHGQGPVGRALREGRPVVVRSTQEDPNFAPWREAAMARGYRSTLALPLLDGDRPLGVLAIYAGDRSAFDFEEMELLEELAANLSYGIAALRTRLQRVHAEQALEREHRLMERVMDTSPAGILVSLPDGRFIYANRHAEEVFHLPREVIYRRRADSEEWRMRDFGGTSLGQSCPIFKRVCDERAPVFREEFSIEGGGGQRLMLSVNAAPVIDDRGEIERIVFTFDDITERRLMELERNHALADNRRLTRRLFRIQESERSEIARELHDELGQFLVALKTEARLLRDTCGGLEDEACPTLEEERGIAERMTGLTNETNQVVRRIVNRLRPVMLETLGLRAAVKGLISDWTRRSADIDWHLTLEGDLDGIDDEVAHAVFRLIQEAVTNIAKYAHADWAQISIQRLEGDAARACGIERLNDVLRLVVEDNGRGMSQSAANSLGQLGMRERVISLDGIFEQRTSAGQGVRIAAIIPAVAPSESDKE